MTARPRSVSTDDLLAHASFLRRLCRELVSDAHAADDLAQDTMVAALERPPVGAGSIAGWLAAVAGNLSRNARRGQARRVEREQAMARDERVEGEQLALDCIEVQQQLLQHLLALPVDQRTVLFMRYYEGLSPSAIATRLNVPVKTIKSRHTRALAALRERLDARADGDRTRWMSALAPACMPQGIDAAWKTAMGGLAVKKMLVAVVLVLVAALAWWKLSPGASTTLSGASRAEVAQLAPSPREAPPMLAPVGESTPREPRPVLTTTTTGTLEIQLLWSDGRPATEIGLDVRCDKNPSPREETFRSVTDARGIALVTELPAGAASITPDMRERFKAEVQAGTTRKVTHTLEAGIEVTGRVVDANGAPVANASIWCKGPLSHRAPDMKRACVCAADGTFVLRDLKPDATFGARARGHRPSSCFAAEDLPATVAGKRSIELRLGKPGGRVNGIVLDPEGKPIEHARVLAGPRGGFQVESPDRIRCVAAFPAAVETGSDGRFEVLDDLEPGTALEPGTQPIYATARGFPVWEGVVDVVEGETQTVEIRLQRPARIEGRLLGLDGQTVPGVDVVAAVEDRGGWSWPPFPPSRCTSDEHGNFIIDWVLPGACELNASDYKRPGIGRAHALVNCEADRTTKIDLRLERGQVIAGRVEDEHGVPLAGWSVNSESASLDEWWYPRTAKTAADGTFTLLNVNPKRSNLLVRAPGAVVERARANGIAAGTSDLVVVVKNAGEGKGTLQGRFVDPSGRSLDDVVVLLWKGGTRAGEFVEFEKDSGRFRNLRTAGRYRVNAMRGTRTVLLTDEFVIAAGEVQDLGDLVFPALGAVEISLTIPATASLELRKQFESLRLALVRPGGAGDESLTAKDGVWRADNLLPGRWRVEMHESELCLRGAELDVREGETTRVELALERAISIPIAFANHGQAAFTVEAWDDSGKFLRHMRIEVETSSAESVVRIGLPIGRARIELHSSDGSLNGKLDVDVITEAGRSKPLQLELH